MFGLERATELYRNMHEMLEESPDKARDIGAISRTMVAIGGGRFTVQEEAEKELAWIDKKTEEVKRQNEKKKKIQESIDELRREVKGLERSMEESDLLATNAVKQLEGRSKEIRKVLEIVTG